MRYFLITLLFFGSCIPALCSEPMSKEELGKRINELEKQYVKILFALSEDAFVEEREECYGYLKPLLQELEKLTCENPYGYYDIVRFANYTFRAFQKMGRYEQETCEIEFTEFCLEAVMRQLQRKTTDSENIINNFNMTGILIERASRNPSVGAWFLEHRKEFMEFYAELLPQYVGTFSRGAEMRLKQAAKDWDRYYHSDQYPKFKLPSAGSFCFLDKYETYPAEFIEDEEKRAEYIIMYEKWRESRNMNHLLNQRAEYQQRERESIIEGIVFLYSTPPFATKELKKILRSSKIEKKMQEEILEMVEVNESEAIENEGR
ncbi:MAG: hypothetical protein Q4D62_12345 [Planctomycetia bacterium]|nr:hypothetical protein [Planctomycetia bacterium]